MKKISLVLFFLVLVCSVSAQVNTRHFVLAGRIDLSEDRFVDAIRNFNTAIYSQPDHFEAYFLRGVAKFSLGDFQGAIEDFTTTLRIHPLYTRAYHYRGIANDRISNYHNALADFNKALEIDPYNADLHVASGATKMHLNRFESAIEDYNLALMIDPTMSYAYLNRGLAKRFLEKPELALEDMNKAVYYDYFDSDAWIRRGMIRYELNDSTGAMSDFNQALILDDKNPLVYFQRALVHLKMGDTLKALEDYERVNILDQRNALTYYNRALIYSLRGELEQAKVLYDEVVKINPQNVYAYFNRGVVNFQMKKFPEAEDDFSAAIGLFPDFAGAWVNRSIIKKERGDSKGSYADYQKAMSIIGAVNNNTGNPDSVFAMYADSSFFNKIIELESDFVSGNVKSNRIQFQDVDIQPFPNFIVSTSFPRKKVQEQANRKGIYIDYSLMPINQLIASGEEMGYVLNSYLSDSLNGLIANVLQKMDSNAVLQNQLVLAKLYGAVSQQIIGNYRNADAIYGSLVSNPEIGKVALFNRAALRYDLEELVLSDVQYNSAITISRQNMSIGQAVDEINEPDYSKVLAEMNNLIKASPNNAFAYYNRANVLLHQKEFHRSIDDYSEAIRLEPLLAEAYYNRALTLLFLSESGLACTDLSKAGELGINESYAVIRKYCGKQ